MPTLTGVNLR